MINMDKKLEQAIRQGNLNKLKDVISKENFSFEDGENNLAVLEAIRFGHLSMLRMMSSKKANINYRDGAALLYAAEFGRLDIFNWLVGFKLVSLTAANLNIAELIAKDKGHGEILERISQIKNNPYSWMNAV